jgi:tRNA pseudouridine38-40 synthase
VKFSHLGLRCAYDGRSFAGFQAQLHRQTLQREIERALSTFTRRKIGIDFSSRTDTGVHAFDQWVQIRNGMEIWNSLGAVKQRSFLVGLNGILHDAVRVWQVLELRDDYHPKRSAEWKEYIYSVVQGPVVDPLVRDRVLWIRKKLDIESMQNSIQLFEGDHDFCAFSKRVERYQGKTIRRILRARLEVKPHPSMETLTLLQFRFRGKGFLHHQVRTMVGTLLAEGRGARSLVARALSSGKRADAGVNAPAHALTLIKTFVPRRLYRSLDTLPQAQ